MISVEDALRRVLALASPVGTETVALRNAAGRVLAADAVARRDQPPFAASAMDGYAICGDTPPAAGAGLRILGEAAAGRRFAGRVGPGEAVRILTGAPMPEGADRIIIQEDADRQGDRLLPRAWPEAGANLRPACGDFQAGFRVAAPRRLGPADVALLAAMNLPELTAFRRPVVALFATGDELVMPGEDPGPDQIVASNSFALKALAEAEGAEVRMLPIARDTAGSLRATFALAEGADVIVTSGGASVGDHDLVAPVAAELGMERAFYKVAMRPGKPLMAGRLGPAVMLGLPGNPVSAVVTAMLFLVPLLRALQGLPADHPQRLRARLGAAVGANGPRAHYMRATLRHAGRGLPEIMPVASQDSSLLRLLAEADALLVRPVGDGPRPAGDEVDYLPLRS